VLVHDRKSCSLARQVLLSCSVVVLLLAAGGCGQSSNTVSVSGNVSYKGQPISKSALAFYPQIGRPTIAPTSDDGAYSTDLAPGDYVVTINLSAEVPPGYKEGDPLPPPKIVLPREYTIRTNSKLTASVSADQSEPIDFALQ
jgi:hypothetical protein